MDLGIDTSIMALKPWAVHADVSEEEWIHGHWTDGIRKPHQHSGPGAGGCGRDLKGLLADIKRNTQGDAPAPAATPYSYERSAEELMRAVNAEIDHPVSDPR
jgi:hypothetical protein